MKLPAKKPVTGSGAGLKTDMFSGNNNADNQPEVRRAAVRMPTGGSKLNTDFLNK